MQKRLTNIKRIGVLTSGGDAPGMNAAIRAVVRMAVDRGWEVYGIRQGYAGLISGDIVPMGARSVGGIIHRGGTILGSSRSPEFKVVEGRLAAIKVLERNKEDAIVIIGGNGSQAGAYELSKMGYPVIGIASTIDNDLYGSDVCLGVDTALNIALEAIDRVKVTASSHRRAFAVEVMGRSCGYLALMSGIAGGAEVVLIPEMKVDPEAVAADLRAAYERGKPHAMIVVAEGATYNAERLLHYFEEYHERLGFELRITILGHVQRGGAPGAADRLLGTQMGAAAVDHLARGEHGILVGTLNGRISATPLELVATTSKQLDTGLLKLANILSR